MRKSLTLLIVAALWLLPMAATAQVGYDEELSQLSASLRSLLVRVEQLVPQESATRMGLQAELFELARKLHRLEEEALGANLELQKRGSTPDKKLLLAAAISKSLDLSQSLASFYLDTREPALWTSANQAAQIARTLLARR